MANRRRIEDALRSVDRIVQSHIQQGSLDARPLANLAVTIATEYSGAARATLLLDEGAGLLPVFALGPGLEGVSPQQASWDAGLVGHAVETLEPAARPDRIAAPVVVFGRALGVIYIESAGPPFDAVGLALVRDIATRVATLVHSASLVADRARREANVRTLEALGACLSAGKLYDSHLAQAVEAAVEATASEEGVLALLGRGGEVRDVHARGPREEELRAAVPAIAQSLLAGDRREALAPLGPGQVLLDVLQGDFLETAPRGTTGPLGFIAVRRASERAYGAADSTMLRALAHLLAGALARLEYFRRASEDTLTKTGSRLALELALADGLEHARRMETPLAVALVDVDQFKSINDTYGHDAGDAVLRTVAEVIRSRLRARDFVARYGGDEFLVLLPGAVPAEAAGVAEELRALVAEEVHAGGPIKVTLSIGIAGFPDHAATQRDLVRRADEALYRSKAAGRNRVTIAEPSAREEE